MILLAVLAAFSADTLRVDIPTVVMEPKIRRQLERLYNDGRYAGVCVFAERRIVEEGKYTGGSFWQGIDLYPFIENDGCKGQQGILHFRRCDDCDWEGLAQEASDIIVARPDLGFVGMVIGFILKARPAATPGAPQFMRVPDGPLMVRPTAWGACEFGGQCIDD